MEEISHLIDAAPKVFHQVIAQTNDQTSSCNIRCLVDHNFLNDDEIQDMYQAFVDVCIRSVASNTIDNIKVQLEYPDITCIDVSFDVARTCEIFKKSGPVASSITLKITYFNSHLSRYTSYFKEIAC